MIEKLAIVGTVGAGLLIGLLWPSGHGGNGSSPAPGTAEVAISRSSDLHYYTDAKVNGRAVHFMIDTGAGETALTEADAKTAGIPVDPNKFEVIGEGASGMVRGQYVQLNDIDVDGLHQQGAKAVVVQGSTVSLLGQPFLDKVQEIVIRDGEMQLKGPLKS